MFFIIKTIVIYQFASSVNAHRVFILNNEHAIAVQPSSVHRKSAYLYICPCFSYSYLFWKILYNIYTENVYYIHKIARLDILVFTLYSYHNGTTMTVDVIQAWFTTEIHCVAHFQGIMVHCKRSLRTSLMNKYYISTIDESGNIGY